MIHKHRFFSFLKHAKVTFLYASHIAQPSPQVSCRACNAPEVLLLVVPHQSCWEDVFDCAGLWPLGMRCTPFSVQAAEPEAKGPF